MSQFNAPIRRAGGQVDVYTALLGVATLVLLAGIALMAMKNSEHSAEGGQGGGIFKLVDK